MIEKKKNMRLDERFTFPTVMSMRRGWAGAKPQDGSESIVVHCPRKWSRAVGWIASMHSKSGKIGGVYFLSPKKWRKRYKNCDVTFAIIVSKS